MRFILRDIVAQVDINKEGKQLWHVGVFSRF